MIGCRRDYLEILFKYLRFDTILRDVEDALEVSIDSQLKADAVSRVIKVSRCLVIWGRLLEVSIDSQPRADAICRVIKVRRC